MNTLSVTWKASQYKKMFEESGKISFDHPIQRRSGQWNKRTQALLVHTLAGDEPFPQMYAVREGEVYYIIDGKQRLTNTFDYINNKYAVDENTPKLILDDGEEYDLSGKYFDDLPQDIQDTIRTYKFVVKVIDGATDEQIALFFEKLQNGQPLSAQQKSRARMGAEVIKKFEEIYTDDFIAEKAHFSTAQLRSQADQQVLHQTLMLLDTEYELVGFESKQVGEYTDTFKNNKEHIFSLVDDMKKYFAYLNTAFEDKDKKFLTKSNFPHVITTTKLAIENEINHETFFDWTREFLKSLKGESIIPSEYKEFMGQGFGKKAKVNGRNTEMNEHFKKFIELNNTGVKVAL